MSKTLWRGRLKLGTIGIPVGLASAYRDGTIRFRQLHAECGTPISQRNVCVACGDENEPLALELEDIVRGFEVSPGEFLVVSSDELQAVAPDPEARTIEIFAAVAVDELDPLAGRGGYLLAPAVQATNRKPYVLLAEALRETNTVALARFAAWTSEHLCALRPLPGSPLLGVQLLELPEDRVLREAFEQALAGVDAATDEERELMAELVTKRLLERVERLDLRSGHRERLRALVDAKQLGQDFVSPEPPSAPETNLPGAELADALRRSLKRTPRPKKVRRPTTRDAAKARS